MRTSTSPLYFQPPLRGVTATAPLAWDDELPAAVEQQTETTLPGPDRSRRLAKPVHLVMLLAFGQSLLFLVIWLFVCASAGAATQKPATAAPVAPELRPSVYQPVAVRDPFLPPGTKLSGPAVVAVGADKFRLEGILWHPTRPSAIINSRLVELNRPAKVATAVGKVEVEAVEITRATW